MKNTGSDFLRELIASARTPAELAQLQAWIDEIEPERESSDEPEKVGRGRPKAPRKDFTVTTIAEVAEFFSVTAAAVLKWQAYADPMPGVDGQYPLPAIVQWRFARLSQSDLGNAKKQIDLEKAEVAVERDRLELAREKGQVVQVADVELWAAAAIVEFREMVMVLPEMIANSAPQEIREFARAETERHCRDALTSLLKRLDTDEISTEGDSADQAG